MAVIDKFDSIFFHFVLHFRMARAYRQNFIDGQSFSTTSKEFSQKVFCGWDFAIMGDKALKRKQQAVAVEFKVFSDGLFNNNKNINIEIRIRK